MKTTRLVIISGLCLFLFNTIKAQVKIGDNPLIISDNRLLEIEENGEYFLVKDTTGMTIGRADASNDPLMLKLFGYGQSPSLFAPGGSNGNQDYFIGTNSSGELLEFPLSLDLTSLGTLSLNNGDINFGSVDLDTVFSTNVQLTDSINTLRTLVATSQAADGDTLTGNEWISSIQLVDGVGGTPEEIGTTLRFTENTTGIGITHTREVDLGFTFATDVQLEDTAAVLRDYNFYLNNNTFDDPIRTASGGGVTNLSFDDLSEFNVSNTPEINLNSTNGDVNLISDASNVTLTASDSVIIDASSVTSTSTGETEVNSNDLDINTTNSVTLDATTAVITTSSDVDVTAANLDINVGSGNLEVDGNVVLEDYGVGKTGSEAYLLGVDASGNVLDVSLDSIGGDAVLSSPVDLDEDGTEETTVDAAIQAANREIDSTIYNYNGTLTGNRTLTGGGLSLTFDDLSTVGVTNTATLDVDATTVDMDGTTLNADYTTSDITTTGDNTIQSSGANVVINANTTLDIDAPTVDIDATDLTIDATNNVGVSASQDVSILANNTATVSAASTNTIVSTGANVSIEGNTNVDINAVDTVNIVAGDNVAVDGNIQLLEHGGGKTGSEAYLLGVDAAGNVLDVSLDSIGGDAVLSAPVDLDEDGTQETTVDAAIQAANREIDSTIYNYDGTLIGMREMDMNNFNLYFISADNADTTVITNDGKMAIGRGTVTPALMSGREIKLDVNGDILAVQVHSSSDKRFKKNIVTVGSALAKVQALRGVTYDFRTDEFENRDFPTERQLGFIAQEVETVIPEVVKTAGDGYKSVDYSKLTALLNEAIKEQQEIINQQQKLIQKQNMQMSAMANKTTKLESEVSDIKNILLKLTETSAPYSE